jgi:aspartyl-tRNA(Asn)/glutamyl-tRNA(Gln) amidotransferase subunit A
LLSLPPIFLIIGIIRSDVDSCVTNSWKPLGLQLIGRPFDEETMLRIAGVLETALA